MAVAPVEKFVCTCPENSSVLRPIKILNVTHLNASSIHTFDDCICAGYARRDGERGYC